MLNAKEVSILTGSTPAGIKQLINNNDWEVHRSSRTSPIKIPPSTVKKVLDSKKLSFNNPQIVTIATQKGGVGKTFTSTNVAVICAARGMKVALIDFDPEACATNTLIKDGTRYDDIKTMLEVYTQDLDFIDVIVESKYENLDIVPCKAKSRKAEKLTYSDNPKKLVSEKLKSLRRVYDLILLDLPPNFSTLTASCYLAADLIIQPCFPNIYSLESIDLTNEDIIETCKTYDAITPEIKILLSAFRSTEKASRETRHVLEDEYQAQLLPFEIGKYQDVSNLINDGVSVLEERTRALSDLTTLVDYICPIVKH